VYVVGYGEDFTTSERRLCVSEHVVEMPFVSPLPHSKTCIGMKHNVRVEDAPLAQSNLSSECREGTSTQTVPTRAAQAYTWGVSGCHVPHPIDDEVAEYILRYVIRECGDSERVFRALKHVGFTQAYTDYCTLKNMRDGRRVAAYRLSDALEVRSSHKYDTLFHGCSVLKPVVDKTLAERLAAPPTFFDSYIVRDFLNEGGNQLMLGICPSNDYAKVIDSYRTLLCRICYRYDCSEHGTAHPLPTRRVDPVYPVLQKWRPPHHRIMDRTQEEGCTKRAGAKDCVFRSVTKGVSDTIDKDPTEFYDTSHLELVEAKVRSFVAVDKGCGTVCWK
jgi:hypothetical protein